MDGKVIIGTELDTKSFEAQIEKLEDELDTLSQEYEAALKDADFPEEELKKYAAQIEKTKNRIIQLRKQQDALNKTDFSSINVSLDNIGKSVQRVTKKVAKWGLAVFGIRSAYMFVRQAISTLSSGNEQLAVDVDYIRYALASTLQPVIERLVELAYKLLAYLGYIIHEWFGINIFENANKGLDKAVGSAKELNKQLAGFDEMNVLNDNSSSGGGITTPSYDLSAWQDIPIPNWVKWIGKNKKLFEVLGGVLLTLFTTSTVSKILSNIAMLFGASGGMGLIGLLETLLAISAPILIVLAVKGVVEAINEMNEFTNAVERNTKISEENKKGHETLTQSIINRTKANEADDEETKRNIEYLKRHVEQNSIMNDSLEKQKNWIGELNGSNSDLRKQQENLRDETIQDIDAWNELTKAGKTTKEEQAKFNETIWNTIKNLEEAGINTDELRRKYETLSGQKYTAVVIADTSRAKTGLEQIIDLLLEIAGFTIKGNFSTSAGNGGGGGGGRGFAKGGIIYHNLPKLAAGGVINQPGRGVPLGSAIGGEKSMEGVIPLTDSQMMSLLGKTIGEYITINANITNTMNGRVISRELQKVQNDSDFAYNR
ncbi:MAG: hypothetical protein IJ690_02080 [Clostridia bacterium]|nr:hypothetical protein [Clostridia bacterium]MBR1653730.1 hypothetical protein [Clostridia bacterium]